MASDDETDYEAEYHADLAPPSAAPAVPIADPTPAEVENLRADLFDESSKNSWYEGDEFYKPKLCSRYWMPENETALQRAPTPEDVWKQFAAASCRLDREQRAPLEDRLGNMLELLEKAKNLLVMVLNSATNLIADTPNYEKQPIFVTPNAFATFIKGLLEMMAQMHPDKKLEIVDAIKTRFLTLGKFNKHLNALLAETREQDEEQRLVNSTRTSYLIDNAISPMVDLIVLWLDVTSACRLKRASKYFRDHDALRAGVGTPGLRIRHQPPKFPTGIGIYTAPTGNVKKRKQPGDVPKKPQMKQWFCIKRDKSLELTVDVGYWRPRTRPLQLLNPATGKPLPPAKQHDDANGVLEPAPESVEKSGPDVAAVEQTLKIATEKAAMHRKNIAAARNAIKACEETCRKCSHRVKYYKDRLVTQSNTEVNLKAAESDLEAANDSLKHANAELELIRQNIEEMDNAVQKNTAELKKVKRLREKWLLTQGSTMPTLRDRYFEKLPCSRYFGESILFEMDLVDAETKTPVDIPNAITATDQCYDRTSGAFARCREYRKTDNQQYDTNTNPAVLHFVRLNVLSNQFKGRAFRVRVCGTACTDIDTPHTIPCMEELRKSGETLERANAMVRRAKNRTTRTFNPLMYGKSVPPLKLYAYSEPFVIVSRHLH